MSQGAAFRRLFVDRGALWLEAGPGELWWLPGAYDVKKMFALVKAAGRVDLQRWRREGEQ